jgi:hypothetical protein
MADRYTKLANRFQQKEPQKHNYDLLRNTFHYILMTLILTAT